MARAKGIGMRRAKRKPRANDVDDAAARAHCRGAIVSMASRQKHAQPLVAISNASMRVKSREEQVAIEKLREARSMCKCARAVKRAAEAACRMNVRLYSAKCERIAKAEKRCKDQDAWRIVVRLEKAEAGLWECKAEQLMKLLVVAKIETEARDAEIALQKVQLARLRLRAPAAEKS